MLDLKLISKIYKVYKTSQEVIFFNKHLFILIIKIKDIVIQSVQ